MAKEFEAGEMIEEEAGSEEILLVKPKKVELDEPEDLALSGLLAELGSSSDAIVRVYESTGQGRRLEYLFECAPEEFSFDKLRDEYGGGDFRIHVRRPGVRGLLANRLISIKRTKKPEMGPQFPVNQITPEQITDAINRGLSEALSRLIPLLQPQSKPIDPTELEDRFMQRMVTMKELFTQPSGGMGNIDLFIKGLEMAKDFGHVPVGDAGLPDLLIEAVRTFGKPLADIVSKQAAMPQAAPQVVGPRMLTPAPTVKAGEKVAIEDNELGPILPYVTFLLVQAGRERDPEIYANLFLDQVDISVAEKYINRADLLESIIKIRPEAEQHRAWLSEFLTLARELLEEERKGLTTEEAAATLASPEGVPGNANIEPASGAGAGKRGPAGDPDADSER